MRLEHFQNQTGATRPLTSAEAALPCSGKFEGLVSDDGNNDDNVNDDHRNGTVVINATLLAGTIAAQKRTTMQVRMSMKHNQMLGFTLDVCQISFEQIQMLLDVDMPNQAKY